jgi:hypothetical protein
MSVSYASDSCEYRSQLETLSSIICGLSRVRAKQHLDIPGKEMQYGTNGGSETGQLKQPKLDVKKRKTMKTTHVV